MASMRKRVRLRRSAPSEDAEIVIIPMIDVMMFLLFFFMVASLAMVVQSGLPVDLPKAATGSQHSSQNVTITIMKSGQVYLNTTVTTIDALQSGLEALHIGASNLVIINADAHVEHGVVVAAMDAARKAGVTRFAIATDKTN